MLIYIYIIIYHFEFKRFVFITPNQSIGQCWTLQKSSRHWANFSFFSLSIIDLLLQRQTNKYKGNILIKCIINKIIGSVYKQCNKSVKPKSRR